MSFIGLAWLFAGIRCSLRPLKTPRDSRERQLYLPVSNPYRVGEEGKRNKVHRKGTWFVHMSQITKTAVCFECLHENLLNLRNQTWVTESVSFFLDCGPALFVLEGVLKGREKYLAE